MKSTRFRDTEKPDLQFTLGYPSETDKLRLRSGTVLQREVTERERRRLGRERKKEKEFASKKNRVTSSSDAMDTDEASRHTQNILDRVNKQQELDDLTSRTVEISSNKPHGNSTEETLDNSDMETTVLDNSEQLERFLGTFEQDQGLRNPSEKMDEDLQRSFTRSLGHGTPPPVQGLSVPFTCVGSGDPVRVLSLYTSNTLAIL